MGRKVSIIILVLLITGMAITYNIPGLVSQESCFKYDLIERNNADDYISINEYVDNRWCSKDVVLPSEIEGISVREIGGSAFSKKEINSLQLSDSIEHIRRFAFYGNNLEKVDIPGNVITVYENAFSGNQINDLVIEEGVQMIFYNAFEDNNIRIVEIPSSVVVIQYNAFSLNPIEEVIIHREENIFIDDWEKIGFPDELKPE